MEGALQTRQIVRLGGGDAFAHEVVHSLDRFRYLGKFFRQTQVRQFLFQCRNFRSSLVLIASGDNFLALLLSRHRLREPHIIDVQSMTHPRNSVLEIPSKSI